MMVTDSVVTLSLRILQGRNDLEHLPQRIIEVLKGLY